MSTIASNRNTSTQRIDTVIHEWLESRQTLLVKLNELIGTAREVKVYPSSLRIQDFCSVLIDYVSCGHFEVYEGILSHVTERKASVEALYPSISTSTDAALMFNDLYASRPADYDSCVVQFDEDLSLLAEQLAARFEWEDQLVMHYKASVNQPAEMA